MLLDSGPSAWLASCFPVLRSGSAAAWNPSTAGLEKRSWSSAWPPASVVSTRNCSSPCERSNIQHITAQWLFLFFLKSPKNENPVTNMPVESCSTTNQCSLINCISLFCSVAVKTAPNLTAHCLLRRSLWIPSASSSWPLDWSLLASCPMKNGSGQKKTLKVFRWAWMP